MELQQQKEKLWNDYKQRMQKKYGAVLPEEIYSRLGGEIEARNTEARADLTPEQRRNTLLTDTQDSSDWIIRDKYGNIRTNSETYRQVIGEFGASYLNEENQNNLNLAKLMDIQGKDTLTIRLATGWEKGREGKWKYEIHYGKLIPEAIKQSRDTYSLAEIFDAPELFNAYNAIFLPDGSKGFASIRVTFEEFENDDQNYAGFFNPETFSISLASYLKNEHKTLRSVLVHELQHAVQRIEGFALGGDRSTGDKIRTMANIWSLRNELKETENKHPELAGNYELVNILKQEYEDSGFDVPTQDILNTAFNLYRYGDYNGAYENAYNQWEKVGLYDNPNDYRTARRLAGETEARNAQRRMDWTDEQRRNNTLASSEDIDTDEK